MFRHTLMIFLKCCKIFDSFMTEVSVPYRNQSIDLQNKSMDWFLFDKDLRREKVKVCLRILRQCTKGLNYLHWQYNKILLLLEIQIIIS